MLRALIGRRRGLRRAERLDRRHSRRPVRAGPRAGLGSARDPGRRERGVCIRVGDPASAGRHTARHVARQRPVVGHGAARSPRGLRRCCRRLLAGCRRLVLRPEPAVARTRVPADLRCDPGPDRGAHRDRVRLHDGAGAAGVSGEHRSSLGSASATRGLPEREQLHVEQRDDLARFACGDDRAHLLQAIAL